MKAPLVCYPIWGGLIGNSNCGEVYVGCGDKNGTYPIT